MENISKISTSIFWPKSLEKYCSMLAEIYVFTGEDVTNAFKGKGKFVPLKQFNWPHHKEDFRYKAKC